jgi:hypothetical protein
VVLWVMAAAVHIGPGDVLRGQSAARRAAVTVIPDTRSLSHETTTTPTLSELQITSADRAPLTTIAETGPVRLQRVHGRPTQHSEAAEFVPGQIYQFAHTPLYHAWQKVGDIRPI